MLHKQFGRAMLPVAWMAVLWAFSSLPGAQKGTAVLPLLPALLQNGMHVVAFAALCAIWLWVLPGTQCARGAWAFALTALYGVVDELHQGYVAGRTSSPLDLLLDGTGAALAVLAFAAAGRAGRRVGAPQ